MLGMNRRLQKLEESGKPIQVALIGAGQMGKGMMSQIEGMKGMKVSLTADINLQNVHDGYHKAGVAADSIKEASEATEANDIITSGGYVATSHASLAYETDAIDVVVDATGVPNLGAELAWNTIQHGKHIVMLNVEADITVGAILYKEALDKGVVYTGSAGDEPGAVMELYDFADALGFDVVALGKGKNNPLNLESNPDIARDEAIRKGANPKMLASFQDGTKTMVEMNAVANATGYVPDQPGMHGHVGTVKDLPSIFRKVEDGGKISKHGIVDYVNGVAPGVFAIVTSDKPEVKHELTYLSMGEGPHYVLYRPYHLTSLETPLSVAKAFIDREPTIAPYAGLIGETVTVAKRDLKAGEYLDGIGEFTVYGKLYEYEEAKSMNALPIGLVHRAVRMKNDVAKGSVITYADVEAEKDTFIWDLRAKQDEMF
ncbi:NAD(P)-dependent oxidoreductase [Paenalkalicoccus suaedae]|uniref:NAD(P)-dependent oxidoreductase n=1 Tax=Paenalkalicoccus suaedae TaxID=2592382 RepID=A0A859FID0_9BACI|nr:NAD(P)-dependent oxidoreductase [Paenalkalicoccus suaedae]QKS72464.1 NAD(P)-dependent oxidoreductase [Paenalkalicoccus suaedae]